MKSLLPWLIAAALSLLSCTGENPEEVEDKPIIAGISLSPREIVVTPGEQVQFTGVINSNETIYGKWSAPEGILEAGPGVFATYTPPPAPGEYFVRYTVPDRPELFAEARVVIKSPTSRAILSNRTPIVGPITELRVSPRGERVALNNPSGEQVILLNAQTLAHEGRIPTKAKDVNWSRSAKDLVVVDTNRVRVFSLESGYLRLELKLEDAVSAIFSDDGASVFMLSIDGFRCKLLEANLRTAERRTFFQGTCDADRMVRGPDGASLILEGGSAQHFSQVTSQLLPTLYARTVPGALRPQLHFSADATLLLAAGQGQGVYHLLRGPDFETPFLMKGASPALWAAAAAPEGTLAALALGPGLDASWGNTLPSERYNLSIIDMADGRTVSEHILGEPKSLFGVGFAGPKQVIVAGEEGVVWRFDLEQGVTTARYPAP